MFGNPGAPGIFGSRDQDLLLLRVAWGIFFLLDKSQLLILVGAVFIGYSQQIFWIFLEVLLDIPGSFNWVLLAAFGGYPEWFLVDILSRFWWIFQALLLQIPCGFYWIFPAVFVEYSEQVLLDIPSGFIGYSQ